MPKENHPDLRIGTCTLLSVQKIHEMLKGLLAKPDAAARQCLPKIKIPLRRNGTYLLTSLLGVLRRSHQAGVYASPVTTPLHPHLDTNLI